MTTGIETVTVSADLIGAAPLLFGKAISSVKSQGEGDDAFEERTWKERLHVDTSDQVFLPPFALKRAMEATGRYLAESIPGKGKKTYTGLLTAGIMCVDPLVLTNNGKPILGKDVDGLREFVPSDGKSGGGRRVWRKFPIVPSWQTVAVIHLLDKMLIDKPKKLEEYLTHCGKFNGLGMWSARRGGYYGRFQVQNFKVSS